MTYFQRIKTYAQKWHRDESGSVAVETVLMVPLLAWAMLATLTYFDAYRNESINFKAGLVIADAISREQNEPINSAYLNGMYGLLNFMTLKDDSPELRITSFRYVERTKSYRRVWSRGRGGKRSLTSAQLNDMKDRLPVMVNGERALLIETWSNYSPPYSVGLGDFDMATYNVISPRFTLRTCFDNSPDDGNVDNSARC